MGGELLLIRSVDPEFRVLPADIGELGFSSKTGGFILGDTMGLGEDGVDTSCHAVSSTLFCLEEVHPMAKKGV